MVMNLLKPLLLAALLAFCFCFRTEADDAELLYRMDEITVDGGKLIKRSTVRIQINNKAGEEFATVQLPYSKINKLGQIEARLLTGNGAVIRKLNSSEINRKSAVSDQAFFDDRMLAEFSLKHSRYPYVVEYSYECRESEFMYLDYWMPVLASTVPTRKAELYLTVPTGFPLRFIANQVGEPLVAENEKTTTYHWTARFEAYRENEIFAPPAPELLPWVRIMPQQFHFDLDGSAESWTSYGNWEFSLLQGLSDLPDHEKLRIGQLLNGVSDTLEMVKLLYHDLQDRCRYVNVSIETGGMKPYPASYVAANRYGDCKALTNYLKSVFEFAGIRCHYVNIFAGEPIRSLDRDFPSQQFNHVILMVPTATDSLWLDCTSKGPFAYVGSFIQNREVFVIREGESHFARTPALALADVAELRKVEVGFPAESGTAVQFNCWYRGPKFERFRSLEESFGEADKARIIRNYFLEDGFELTDYSIEKQHRDSAFVAVSYKTNTARLFQHLGNETVVKNLPFALPRLQKPLSRPFPVQLDTPVFCTDTLLYELGEQLQVSGRAADEQYETRFGSYQMTLELEGKQLRVVKQLVLNSGKYPLDEYVEFYNFIERVKNSESKPLLILTKPE